MDHAILQGNLFSGFPASPDSFILHSATLWPDPPRRPNLLPLLPCTYQALVLLSTEQSWTMLHEDGLRETFSFFQVDN